MKLHLVEIREQLELLINATPSGTLRNTLTNANIYLLQAEAIWKGQPAEIIEPKDLEEKKDE